MEEQKLAPKDARTGANSDIYRKEGPLSRREREHLFNGLREVAEKRSKDELIPVSDQVHLISFRCFTYLVSRRRETT